MEQSGDDLGDESQPLLTCTLSRMYMFLFATAGLVGVAFNAGNANVWGFEMTIQFNDHKIPESTYSWAVDNGAIITMVFEQPTVVAARHENAALGEKETKTNKNKTLTVVSITSKDLRASRNFGFMHASERIGTWASVAVWIQVIFIVFSVTLSLPCVQKPLTARSNISRGYVLLDNASRVNPFIGTEAMLGSISRIIAFACFVLLSLTVTGALTTCIYFGTRLPTSLELSSPSLLSELHPGLSCNSLILIHDRDFENRKLAPGNTTIQFDLCSHFFAREINQAVDFGSNIPKATVSINSVPGQGWYQLFPALLCSITTLIAVVMKGPKQLVAAGQTQTS